jgi:CheY-like chemotaxis protein
MQQQSLDNKATRPAIKAARKAGKCVPTIILADDSILQRMTTRALLECEGYHVLEAADGHEVIELVHLAHPDLILMDIAMPTMDGVTATRRLRGEGGASARVPVVFLTALSAPSDRATALAAGGDDYLVKPIGDRELLRVVEQFC